MPIRLDREEAFATALVLMTEHAKAPATFVALELVKL